MYTGNFASFTAKEVEKIKAKGVASFYKPQDQEVALPLLHHQAKAKGWPLQSPFVSCRGCSDSQGGLHDQGQHAALAKALTPV